jgi:hypothetical protein
MENVKEKVEELTDNVKGYVDTLYELALVKVTQKAADTAAFAITGIVIFIFLVLVLLLGGFGIGWWLGRAIDSMAGGFLIVTGFYLLCLVFVLLAGKKTLIPMIRDRIVRKLYD